MQIMQKWLFVLALCLLWRTAGLDAIAQSSPSLETAVDSLRAARLRSHGLAVEPRFLLHFLEYGFAPEISFRSLPTTPALKTQIVIDAIVELTRLEAKEAAPILARMVRGDTPDGVRRIQEWDIAQQRQEDRVRFERETRSILHRDAVVGLGLVGDADDIASLADTFEDSDDPDLKIPCALALATLGSGRGVPYLMELIEDADRETAARAARALEFITGRNYGPGQNDPVARRRQAVRDWETWWKANDKSYQPDPRAVKQRRLSPPVRPNPRQPQRVRDLLDCMAYPGEGRWTIDPYVAYERLRTFGPGALVELAQIAQDTKEDLEIRRRAIVFYTNRVVEALRAGKEEARDVRKDVRSIRRLRRDRNPEIREIARECVEKIDNAR